MNKKKKMNFVVVCGIESQTRMGFLIMLFVCIFSSSVSLFTPFTPPLNYTRRPPPPPPAESLFKSLCENISNPNGRFVHLTFVFNISGEGNYELWNSEDGDPFKFNSAAVIYEDRCFAARFPIDDKVDRSQAKFEELSSLEILHNQHFYSVVSRLQNCSEDYGKVAPAPGGDVSLANLSSCRTLEVLKVAGVERYEKNLTGIASLTNLKNLNLSSTNLTGIIPSDVCNLVNLTSLDLSNNRLEGSIPFDFWKLEKLESLILSHNSLNGPIPNLITMENLAWLNLSNNDLSGNISVPLQDKLKNIPTVDLSGNPGLLVCSENQTFLDSIGLINSCPTSVKTPTNQPEKKNKIVIPVLLSLLLVVLLLSFFLFFVLRKKSKRSFSYLIGKNCEKYNGTLGPYSFQTPSVTWDVNIKLPTSVPVIVIDKPLLNLTFADLLSATNQFDKSALISEGRSGLVYCGELRGGVHIAIKVLVQGSFLSDQELASELERLGRIKHPHLVPLIGYCFVGSQRMVISEYMENCSLHNLLHDFNSIETASEADAEATVVVEQEWNLSGINGESYEPYNDDINTWSFRHRLAVGIARGLAFLHHACSPQIVHGDVKSSSIFLDSEFKPRFSNYGLAKITINPDDENHFGSPGYVPPDLSFGPPTAQSDVYSFGVVLFEILTGKKPRDDEYPGEKDGNLVSWVRGLVIKGEASKAIDSSIRLSGPVRQMEESLKIGYLCTSETFTKRPTMQQVLGLLKDINPGGFGE